MQTRLAIVTIIAVSATLAHAGEITGKITGGKGASAVWVEKVPGKTSPKPSQHFSLDQRQLMFQPHVLAVPVGATVDFVNSDSVAHNVFWPSISGNRKLAHNLGTWPQGDKRSFTFDTPGVVPLVCNVHPEMSGYIVVAPTPYYALADADGNYKIENVPDGNYSLSVWHEGKPKLQTKTLAVNGSTKFDVSF